MPGAPAATCSRMNRYASSRWYGGTTRVATGWRPGRHLAELADVDVAVHGELQRAGDRRRGHGQEVGRQRALAAQPLTLRDAEAMLLVDDHEAEVAERDVVLDERVRPDQQAARGRWPWPRGSRARARAGVLPTSSRGAMSCGASMAVRVAWCWRARISVGAITAVWNPARWAISAAIAAITVLPLPTSPWSSRFIEPLAGHVGEHLVGGDALTLGEPERQRRGECPRHLDVVRDDHPGAAEAPPARPLGGKLEQEELLERDALVSAGPALLVVGEVHLVERRADGHQAARRSAPPAAGGLEGSRRAAAGARSSCAACFELTLSVSGYTGASRPTWRCPAPTRSNTGLRNTRFPRACALHLAADQELGAAVQLVDEESLVEPDGADDVAAVHQRGLDQPHLLALALVAR